MIKRRRRFKQTQSLQARLQAFARDARAKASAMPSCARRDDLLKRAGQAETAAHIDEWISSPELQEPIKREGGLDLPARDLCSQFARWTKCHTIIRRSGTPSRPSRQFYLYYTLSPARIDASGVIR